MTHRLHVSTRTQTCRGLALRAALALGLLSACGNREPAPAPTPAAVTVPWNANAVQYRGRNGAVVSLHCPSGGSKATVWGTDLYSDDSSVCTAALHAGRVTLAAGGTVQIAIAPGAPSYQGSVRNDVTTSNYGAFPGSFTIVGGPAPGLVATALPTAPVNPWSENASRYRGRNAEAVVVQCAAGGTPATVWGTDVYTDDSSVCTAALHAGRITTAGGPVTIYPRAGQSAYRGTARNGVTTHDFATFPGSFAFDPNAVGETPAPAGTTAFQWSTNASQYRGRDRAQVRVFCPPGGAARTVWGTRVYTDDSSVCTAAVHAGLATFERGGTFTLAMTSGKRRYRGSAANGVTTQDFATFPGSFTLSR
jgi:hypothetical protein